MPRALILTGGSLGDVALAHVPGADFVVAADSGLHHAEVLNTRADVVIGDLDSVDHSLLAGIEVIRHPVDKAKTDIELALDYAVAKGADDIVVVGGGEGGRLDHLLGNAFVLTSPAYANVRVSAFVESWRLWVTRDTLDLTGEIGQLISIYPVNGSALGVTIEGLRWSGYFKEIEPGSSLGLSNRFVERECQIRVEDGTLLVAHFLGSPDTVQ